MVVVKTCSWLREKFGAQAVLTVASAGRSCGHGDSSGYFPQRHCVFDASEPARAWGRGGTCCVAGPSARGATARLVNGASEEQGCALSVA
jgi:hypothetical protein